MGDLKAEPGGELQVHGTTTGGVTIQVYRPVGRPQYATTAPTRTT